MSFHISQGFVWPEMWRVLTRGETEADGLSIFSVLLYAEQLVGLQGQRPLGMLQDIGNRVTNNDAIVYFVACVERLKVKPHPRPLSEERGDETLGVVAYSFI